VTLLEVRDESDLGEILTDAEGRTLYLFEADSSDSSTCYDDCAKAWPPLIASGKPEAGAGVAADLLGTTDRKDGEQQVTYDGHPLYYYEGDNEPGDTAGQGLDQFGGKWYALDTSGAAVKAPGEAETEEPDQDGGGGY
jgi:predicted lipoprotein with Yx(FWY)xxD motif